MNQKISSLYVLEGLDGVGKSTAAKSLAEKIGASYTSTPLDEFKQKVALPGYERGANERFSYYMAGNYHFSDKVKAGEIKAPLIIDRFVLSTLAYHNAILSKDLTEQIDWKRLIEPEICFFLYAEESVRKARMDGRDNRSATDIMLEKDFDLARRIEKEYLKLSDRFVVIDTTRLNQNEVVDKILSYIGGSKNGN
jgi:thymidylate kinase